VKLVVLSLQNLYCDYTDLVVWDYTHL